jgi:hypothetical protein
LETPLPQLPEMVETSPKLELMPTSVVTDEALTFWRMTFLGLPLLRQFPHESKSLLPPTTVKSLMVTVPLAPRWLTIESPLPPLAPPPSMRTLPVPRGAIASEGMRQVCVHVTGRGMVLTFADVTEPHVAQGARALALDAFDGVNADDDVAEGGAVLKDEDLGVGALNVESTAVAPVELAIGEVLDAGDDAGARQDGLGAVGLGDGQGLGGGRAGEDRGEKSRGVHGVWRGVEGDDEMLEAVILRGNDNGLSLEYLCRWRISHGARGIRLPKGG